MKKLKTLITLCALCPGLLSSSEDIRNGWNGKSEYLEFSLTWLYLPGGTAVIQAEPSGKDMAIFKIQACTNPTLDMIHKVRDSITTVAEVNKENYKSHSYRFKQQEGQTKQDLEIAFADDQLQVTDNKQQEIRYYKVPENTLDMVTAFFKSRTLALQPGETYAIPVFDKNKDYKLEVEVVGKEKINTIFGKLTPTIIIKPKLQSDGIFDRKGDIKIWLTDDKERIPVRMESKVKIGSIRAELSRLNENVKRSGRSQLLCESKMEGLIAKRN